MTQFQFRTLAVIGPVAAAFALPMIFSGTITNLLWGSVFGLGLCLGAFAQGGLWEGPWARVGLWWVPLVPVLLYIAGGWVWRVLPERRRKTAAAAFVLSLLVYAPLDAVWRWDQRGLHLPDILLHLASFH